MSILIRGLDKESLFFAFNFSESFLKDLNDCSAFSIQFNENTMFLGFNIPTFRKLEMFSVVPKPIFDNFATYFLQTDVRYLVLNERIFHTENEIDDIAKF